MRVVVCDDDPTIRSVVSKLASAAGHSVLAETDSGPAAVEMVLRFQPEVLILDLDLAWGAGLQAVRDLREADSPVDVVVFTDWAADAPEVRSVEVRAVIEKPDFDSLERVLADLAAGFEAATPEGAERRHVTAPRPAFPHHGRISASGLEDPDTFAEAVLALEPGDAVLVVHVAGVEYAASWYEQVAAADQVLAVTRLLRTVLRAQDRLALAEPSGDELPVELVALVLGGRGRGIESVWRRLVKAHDVSSLPGIVSAGYAVCDDGVLGPMALERARQATARSVGRPPGDRLWAG
jgi:CheY-like chemotaxis protein